MLDKMLNDEQELIFAALLELGDRIEKCGGSPELTHALTLCCAIRGAIGNRWNPPDENSRTYLINNIPEQNRGKRAVYETQLLQSAEKELESLRAAGKQMLSALEVLFESTIPYKEDGSSAIQEQTLKRLLTAEDSLREALK